MQGEATGKQGRRSHLRWLLLLTLLAFALRTGGLLSQSLWRDEVDSLRFATRDLSVLLNNFRRSGENGPLYFLLLRAWFGFAGGADDYALRFFSVLPAVATVPLVGVLGRRLLSPAAGIWAALLAATSPYLVWYAQEGKMYALVTALALGALVALEAALRRGGWARWLAVWLLTTLAAYIHIMALWLIAVEAVWFAAAWPRSRARWRGALAVLAGLTLPYLPIALWQVRLLFWEKWQPGFAYFPLPDMVAVSLTAYLRGVAHTSGWTLWPFLGVALLGLAWHWPSSRAVWMLAGWFTVPLLGLWLVSLKVPLFVERYLIWTLPALLLLAARGLEQVRRIARPLFAAALCGLLLLNGGSLWRQATEPLKSDFRAAAQFVQAQGRQRDEALLFLIPYVRHTFAHYFGDPAPAHDAPFTNGGMTAAELAAQMAALTADYRGVWLVVSEWETWDARGLVRAWLDAHGTVTASARFAQVEVVRYRLRNE